MKTARHYAEEPPDVGSCKPSSSPAASHSPRPASAANSLKPIIAKRDRSKLRVSARSREFLAEFYPQATVDDWNDWRWQNRNRVRTLADLERMIALSGDDVGEG